MNQMERSELDPGMVDRRRILIVDDDETVRYLCSEALNVHDISQSENGLAGFQQLSNDNFDVVLTDVMMPRMDGLELLRKVKERDPNQIVIVMTSFSDKKTVLQALKSNADDFIEKPIDILQVKMVVERALEKQQLREELLHLKQIDKLKSDFLGLISHKLKTPITIISLSTQVLADKAEEIPDPAFSRNLKATREQAGYLVSLIEELLRFSDTILQEEGLRLERTDMRELVASCIEEIEGAAGQRKIALSVQMDDGFPSLPVDRKRLSFVVHALLDNAVKFTPPGGQITVSGKAAGGEALISVADTGEGIIIEEQGKVFEKFYQIDPDYTGQIRGFGLGLFYARQFAVAHGGRLELESTPGKGSTFTLSLPLSEKPPC